MSPELFGQPQKCVGPRWRLEMLRCRERGVPEEQGRFSVSTVAESDTICEAQAGGES